MAGALIDLAMNAGLTAIDCLLKRSTDGATAKAAPLDTALVMVNAILSEVYSQLECTLLAALKHRLHNLLAENVQFVEACLST